MGKPIAIWDAMERRCLCRWVAKQGQTVRFGHSSLSAYALSVYFGAAVRFSLFGGMAKVGAAVGMARSSLLWACHFDLLEAQTGS
jgi:hypothetical protein